MYDSTGGKPMTISIGAGVAADAPAIAALAARTFSSYRKTGFRDVGSHVFMVGEDAQTDRILIRPLRVAR